MQISENILYKNNQLIALNKPATVAVQEDKSEDKSLLNLAEIYCKSSLFLLNRIDRPASGVVLFAKNKKAAAHLSEQLKTRKVQKTYLAVVKNAPPKKEDTLTHFVLKQNSQNRSMIVETAGKGAKEAVLKYTLLDKIDNYHLLQIDLITGRHHQIRAQLAAIDCPIKGDVKYGFRRGNRDRSIHLHAWKMSFQHPVNREQVELVAPVPDESVWNAFDYLKNIDPVEVPE